MCSLLCCLPMKLEQLNKMEVHTGICLIKYVTFIAVISPFRWLMVLGKFLISTLYFSPALVPGGKSHTAHISIFPSLPLIYAPLLSFFLFSCFSFLFHVLGKPT